MSDLETREFQVRLEAGTDVEERTVSGVAVPWETDANIGGQYFERFAKGSIQTDGTVMLFWRHDEPIGKLVGFEDTDDGWSIRAQISKTPRGDEAYTLLRDGVISKFSIGFKPVEQTRDDTESIPTITRTAALVREVSLVPLPAYSGASVTEVREGHPIATKEATNMADETVTSADLSEIRGLIEDVDRKVDTINTRSVESAAPVGDPRSAAAFLKDLVKGEERAAENFQQVQDNLYSELQHRAYTGGTTADASLQNVWVGDITRIIDNSSGVLSQVFSTGTLPSQGMTLEYGKLNSNTVTVTKQANEGDDLPIGKVTLTTATAQVNTYGGAIQLSRQAIERSTMPLLAQNLRAAAIAAGQAKKSALRVDFDAVVAARRAVASNGGVVLGGAALGSMTPQLWLTSVVEAAFRFDPQGYAPQALIVSKDVFLNLAGQSTTGERLLRIGENNSAGTLDIPGLRANLAGLPVIVNTTPTAGQDTGQAVFVHGDAIRQYDSATATLQDDNVLNLTKLFSVYFYGAIADEQPGLIVPIKFAAS